MSIPDCLIFTKENTLEDGMLEEWRKHLGDEEYLLTRLLREEDLASRLVTLPGSTGQWKRD